ncbi:hypothetical protein A2U01_0082715, partial [Trifolium medium]|nr:hypothetical protein [Trifolium medium]
MPTLHYNTSSGINGQLVTGYIGVEPGHLRCVPGEQ